MRADRLIAAAALVSTLAIAASANAFCRTTTCGPNECTPDPNCQYCLVGGLPLYWPGGCVSFSVNDAGSPKSGIDSATLTTLVTNAAATWIGVQCTNGMPGLFVYPYASSSCGIPDFSEQGPNANVWMFRDDQWPHAGSQLALTTVTFDIDTGKLYDADVEINSAENQLTVGDTGVVWDLESIVVHESGHFFGLAHSCVAGATMEATFDSGQTSLRTLEQDDAEAICTVYPPGGNDPNCDPTPRNGFTSTCSGVSGGGGSGGSGVGGASVGGNPGVGGADGGSYGSNQSAAKPVGCSCGVPSERTHVAWLASCALLAALGWRRRRR